jgi:hypothetical protein
MEKTDHLYDIAALPPGTLYRGISRPHSRSGHCKEEKNLTIVVNRTPVVQPLTHHYTVSYPDSKNINVSTLKKACIRVVCRNEGSTEECII